jgi:hypothetical protein
MASALLKLWVPTVRPPALTGRRWPRPSGRPAGLQPLARHSHTATLISTERLIVFGGWTERARDGDASVCSCSCARARCARERAQASCPRLAGDRRRASSRVTIWRSLAGCMGAGALGNVLVLVCSSPGACGRRPWRPRLAAASLRPRPSAGIAGAPRRLAIGSLCLAAGWRCARVPAGPNPGGRSCSEKICLVRSWRPPASAGRRRNRRRRTWAVPPAGAAAASPRRACTVCVLAHALVRCLTHRLPGGTSRTEACRHLALMTRSTDESEGRPSRIEWR